MNIDLNNYPGAKGGNGVYQWIINHIPKHQYYNEPLCGSATIAIKLRESLTNPSRFTFSISDIDLVVVAQLLEKYGIAEKYFSIKNSDCLKVFPFVIPLKYPQFKHEHFTYLDPPYLFDTIKSKRHLYKHTWTRQQHVEFLDMLTKASNRSLIMISHYDCDLYKEKLKGWFTSTFWTVNRAGDRVEEKIWMNYDVSKLPLMSTRYIGTDFTNRQQVKRKLSSLERKYQSLSRHEKQAFLERIH